ncbi:MAG: phosphoribosylformylglycinamidine synthase, partial [Fuerstiella sp.]|nr:phosphoribosylformylglycinamidine synthase [Fuerstiella sp.]
LNNEFSYEDKDGKRQTVAIPSTLLITALGQIGHVEQAVTMDLKASGNKLCLVGVTRDELGGSHFNLVNELTGGTVPNVDSDEAVKVFSAVHQAIKKGLVRSCHDLSEGGLAVAAAEMAFAGGVGAKINLTDVAVPSDGSDDDGLAFSRGQVSSPAAVLFSESNTRFLVEVEEAKAAEFAAVMGDLVYTCVGETTDDETLQILGNGEKPVVSESLAALKESWQSPLNL